MESIQVFGRASLNEREEKEVHKTETRKPTAQPLHVIVEDKDYQLHAKVKAVAVSAAEILSNDDYTGQIFEIDTGIIGWIESGQTTISN